MMQTCVYRKPVLAPRVPRSSGHLRRAAPAANSFRLCGILQPSAYPLGIRERCAHVPQSPAIWHHCRRSDLGWAASPIRSDMIFGKERENAMNMSNGAKAGSSATDPARGMALLRDPLLNKGTAFTEHERDALGLRGLLPAHVLSMEAHAKRVMTNLHRLPNDLEKYVALNGLHDRNEALFFRVVSDNIDEIQPLIYTPTVGLACQRFGHIFQRPRGSSSAPMIAGASPNFWPTGPIQPSLSS